MVETYMIGADREIRGYGFIFILLVVVCYLIFTLGRYGFYDSDLRIRYAMGTDAWQNNSQIIIDGHMRKSLLNRRFLIDIDTGTVQDTGDSAFVPFEHEQARVVSPDGQAIAMLTHALDGSELILGDHFRIIDASFTEVLYIARPKEFLRATEIRLLGIIPITVATLEKMTVVLLIGLGISSAWTVWIQRHNRFFRAGLIFLGICFVLVFCYGCSFGNYLTSNSGF